MKRFFYLLSLCFIFLTPFKAYSKNPAIRFHVKQDKIILNQDLTSTRLLHREIDVLTPEGIEVATKISHDYNPKWRTFTIKEAFVLQPDGTKVSLSDQDIFTRPSAESQNAPGFSNNLTTTLLFPKVMVGSRLVFTLEEQVKEYGPWGFYYTSSPDFFFPTDFIETILETPLDKDFFLQVEETRGFPFKQEEDFSTQKRIFKASLRNVPAHEAEPGMISPQDLLPSFYTSTLPDWESIGRIYAEQAAEKLIITPEIQELSDHIVGSSQEREAAQKIYNWMAKNITYVGLYLDPQNSTVPHVTSEILKNHYGDCKDQVALMQALLKCQGIESYTALINASNTYSFPPIPLVSYFNHAIIYIPKFNIYADPTVRFQSFGVLTPDLYDKFVVLAIPPNGKRQKAEGRVARTPPLDPLHNIYRVNSKITLLNSGTFEGENSIYTTGVSSSELRSFFARLTDNPEEMAASVLQMTPEGGVGTMMSPNPYVLDKGCEAKGQWKNLHSVSMSKETFFHVPYGIDFRLALPSMRSLFTLKPRLYPLTIVAGIDQWSYEIVLSDKMRVFHLPFPKRIENSAGFYQSSYQQKGNSLFIERTLRFNKCIYPPQEQQSLMSLVETLLQDLQQVIGIKRLEKQVKSLEN